MPRAKIAGSLTERAQLNDPAIVHFTLGRRKPWETLAHPRAREWLSYARRTPYRDMIDAHLCAAAANGKPRKKASQRSSLLWHVLGWGKSLVELRKIRVDIDGLRKMVEIRGGYEIRWVPLRN